MSLKVISYFNVFKENGKKFDLNVDVFEIWIFL